MLEQRVDEMFNEAMDKVRQGDLEGAASLLTIATTAIPRPEIYVELCKIHMKKRSYDLVERYAKLGLEKCNHNVPKPHLVSELENFAKSSSTAAVETRKRIEHFLKKSDSEAMFKLCGLEPGLGLKLNQQSARISLKPGRQKIGESRIGGSPDVPAEFEWPKNSTGEYFHFLCQINLQQLNRFKFAKVLAELGGILAFFYDPECLDEAKVIHFESKKLKSASTPSQLKLTKDAALNIRVASFVEQATFPSVEQAQMSGSEVFDSFSEDQIAAYSDFYDIWHGCENQHRMFGYAQPTGNSDHTEDTETVLLLQLDSDGEHLNWGDNGRITFRIKEEALAAADFSKTKIVLLD